MTLASRFRSWLRATFLRSRTDNEMDSELRFHIEARAQDPIHQGLSPEDPARRSRIEFGGIESAREECREVRRANMLETLIQDIRFGARVLLKNPTFSIVAVLTLALGIGANTAMFSIADAVLWRAMPYPHPEQLVTPTEVNEKDPKIDWGATYPTFRDWQSRSTSFQNLAGTFHFLKTLREGSDPVRIQGLAVTYNYFDVMGVSPAAGRVFAAQDDKAGAALTIVLSHRMWSERFNSDPAIIGRSINFAGLTFTVIGVMPAGFDDGVIECWVPLTPVIPQGFTVRRDVWILDTVGRLRPGRTAAQAQSELEAITAQLRPQFPSMNRGLVVAVPSLRAKTTSDIRPALLVLLGAVGLVLLVACANLAALTSVRAAGRGRELATRAALGAGRWRLIAQLLTESALLSFAGAAAGVALAFWATRSLALLSKDPRLLHASINVAVLLFALAAAVVTSVLAGIAPALHHTKETLNTHNSGHRRRAKLQQALVIGEVALCLVLLVGAGLLFKTLRNILDVDAGFRTDRLITMRLGLPATYKEDPQILNFYRNLSERLQSLPGISGATVVSSLPISGGEGTRDINIEGRPSPPGSLGGASFHRPLPNYFQVMGIPLLRGRVFEERDDGTRNHVVIINERMSRNFWPNSDPLGARIKIGPPENNFWMTIVGVVKDVHLAGLDDEIGFSVYMPLAEQVGGIEEVAVRTHGDPTAAFSEVRGELHSIEPSLLVDHVGTMDQRIEDSVSPRKLNLLLFGLFSSLALVLASIGLYGVVAYSVGQRTQEFGIRMALGAQRTDVIRLVLGQGLKLALAGTAIGVAFALAVARLLRQLLFGVRPADPATIASVALILTIVALAACWLPAFRASHIEPTQALRNE